MNFIQPWLLAALPFIALPIVIHLINQRRYQSVPWGAMMFLLTANRMSRGYARIRQWIILLLRTLVITALIFAISRPLASGWVGAAAGRSAGTAIVILDRSPSMQQRGIDTPVSKLDTGIAQLANTLSTLGSTKVTLIDGSDLSVEELPPESSFAGRSDTSPFDTTTDIPSMVMKALEYLEANQTGQADIWICSDLRAGDWNQEDGRWESIRQISRSLNNRVRFHLLTYPKDANDNLSVHVSNAKRLVGSSGEELVLTVHLRRGGISDAIIRVPLDIEVAGVRSRIEVDFEGNEFELRDYRLPIPENLEDGWGKVSIPGDSNPADNEAFFVFDAPPIRKTLVVGDDESVMALLQLASSISPSPNVSTASDVRASGELEGIAWEQYALILWHGPLPKGKALEEIQHHVERGGVVMFLPPQIPGNESAFGIRWGAREELDSEVQVETWRNDDDLFRQTQAGQSLPVGSLKVRAIVPIEGEQIKLAAIGDGRSIVSRAPTERGAAYFWGISPSMSDSSLASDGIVFYVAIQRALELGSEVLSKTRQLEAGESSVESASQWQPLAIREGGFSDAFSVTAGAYQDGGRLLAVNRPAKEDITEVLTDESLQKLFQDIPFDRVDDSAGNLSALVHEIWRIFLIGMMAAMVLEAAMCLPRRPLGNESYPRRGASL